MLRNTKLKSGRPSSSRIVQLEASYRYPAQQRVVQSDTSRRVTKLPPQQDTATQKEYECESAGKHGSEWHAIDFGNCHWCAAQDCAKLYTASFRQGGKFIWEFVFRCSSCSFSGDFLQMKSLQQASIPSPLAKKTNY